VFLSWALESGVRPGTLALEAELQGRSLSLPEMYRKYSSLCGGHETPLLGVRNVPLPYETALGAQFILRDGDA